VAESFILYLQLGDGDILTVSERGEVTRPLPDDTRLFADQTTSLCIPEAWRDFRIRFQGLTGAPPALILLSTDGYANSFVNEAAFLQVGGDIWDLLRAQGLEQVQASLVGWLTEASEKGSGDDITLALLCRTELLPAPEELAAQAALAESPVAPEEPPALDESVAPPGNRRLWYDDPDFDEESSAPACSEAP